MIDILSHIIWQIERKVLKSFFFSKVMNAYIKISMPNSAEWLQLTSYTVEKLMLKSYNKVSRQEMPYRKVSIIIETVIML